LTALRIAVVGGGIGGAAAARALLQRGFEVDLFEQSTKLSARLEVLRGSE
jgi:salicylate hydroxylase